MTVYITKQEAWDVSPKSFGHPVRARLCQEYSCHFVHSGRKKPTSGYETLHIIPEYRYNHDHDSSQGV